jgi:hypothetical protein
MDVGEVGFEPRSSVPKMAKTGVDGAATQASTAQIYDTDADEHNFTSI